MTHDYDAAIAAVQKAWEDNIQAHGRAKVWGYTNNLANAVAGIIVNEAYPPTDIDDLAEAYLEAAQQARMTPIGPDGIMYIELGHGIYTPISRQQLEAVQAVMDAAEDEGWDVEEMEGLK